MTGFAVRLFIAIGIIVLTQLVTTNLNVRPDIRNIILVVVTIVAILFLLFGNAIFPLTV